MEASSIVNTILSPLVIVPVVIVLVVFVLIRLFVRNYIKVPSNRVAVFTGSGRQVFVTGGAKLKIPGFHDVRDMSLEGISVKLELKNAPSKDGVPVNVDAVGLVRIGSEEEMLATAVSLWLDTNPQELQSKITDQMEGSLRAIVASMTVESLNQNREELATNVLTEASETLKDVGMEVKAFKIQSISDDNGYLTALGQGRIAQVKRDATIAEAEADRAARTAAAAAQQAAEVAEANAKAAISDATRERDIRIAENDAKVQSQQATAAQAGPLATAEARTKVEIANAAADEAREKAGIAVQQQRALKAQQAQKADTIIPAEAARDAAIAKAAGDRAATIAGAEAEAAKVKLAGTAEAEARTAKAGAMQVEQEAAAAGKLAGLRAEAAGMQELATAQNAFTESAQRLQVLPKLIEVLPQIVESVAKGINIDHMVVMDGGSGSGNESALKRASSTVPVALFQANESLKALGLDLGGFLGNFLPSSSSGDSSDSSNGHHDPSLGIEQSQDGVPSA